jgi:hypothetical protein
VKITRPVVGMLLLILLSGLMALLLLIALWIPDHPSGTVVLITIVLELTDLGLAGSIILLAGSMNKPHEAKFKQLRDKYGGWLRASINPEFWREARAITSPYAPRWMHWLAAGTAIAIMVLAPVRIYLRHRGMLELTYGGSMAHDLLSPLLLGLVSLPTLYSNWREQSQPADSPSPEVRAL